MPGEVVGSIAHQGLQRIAALYAIEASLRDVLARIADQPINRGDELPPSNIGGQRVEQRLAASPEASGAERRRNRQRTCKASTRG